LSETDGAVLNVDIGGGTTKVVVCRDGRTTELMAMDVGARVVAFDERGRLMRIEPSARRIAERTGAALALGQPVPEADQARLVRYMVDELMRALRAGDSELLRTPGLRGREHIATVTFSGGVSEFIYGRATATFGDLGALLAEEIRQRQSALPAAVREVAGGIRATVIGASQYTIQVSGSTIYLSPLDVVPVRNIPVVMPAFPWHEDDFTSEDVARVIADALRRFDLVDAEAPVAIAAQWEGSATYGRIKAFCSGAVAALGPHVANGHPLILVFDNDIGGVLGVHVRGEMKLDLPIISIDGLELREFDFIDIGNLIPTSGAVPVVIKSLVFPT